MTHPMTIPPPRVAIIGSGAMGVSLAATLGTLLPVTIVVRNAAAAATIAEHGVSVSGLMRGDARPRVVRSITQLNEAGPFDTVFVATKTTAIDAVADELRPVLPALTGPLGPPFVISFQNGIEPGLTLSRRLSHARVLRMVLTYGAILSAPNAAAVTLATPPHFIGGPDAALLPDATALAAHLTRCGLPTEPVASIEPAVWRKGIVNAATNPVAALTDSSVGEVLDSPARSIVAGLIDEGLGVAAAEGIDLGPGIAERMWAVLEAARPHTPSMVGDIRAGRPTEIGQLNRQIIRHAHRLGVPTPSHELIASLIDAFDWRVFRRRPAPPMPKPSPEPPTRLAEYGATA
jgi:2-dehydropantoate 2-reductase